MLLFSCPQGTIFIVPCTKMTYDNLMSKKKNFRDGRKGKSKGQGKDSGKLAGFSNLNQVAGVPKPYDYHSKLPVLPTTSVVEPNLVCALCGKTIETISSALCAPDGKYVHFDCVLEDMKAKNHLLENQSISYIGSGNFAIVEKDENGSYTIVSRIPYEDHDHFDQMKMYVESLKK